MTRLTWIATLMAVLGSAFLVACGGGGGGSSQATGADPFFSAAVSLLSTPENGEPVAVDTLSATTPEAGEPFEVVNI